MKAAIILCIIGLLGSAGHAADHQARGPGAAALGRAGARGARYCCSTCPTCAPRRGRPPPTGRAISPCPWPPGARVLPQGFELGANYPNPFNPSTMIPYQLPNAMHVRLEVFNILGQRVATLVDGEQPAGFHTASWNATDVAGEAVAAGVYLYRLSGDGVRTTRSMVLIDGQAGIPSGRGASSTGLEGDSGIRNGEPGSVYGLTVSAPGRVPYVDPAFRVEAGMGPLDVVLEAPGRDPSAKAASSGGLLGDVDNTDGVDFFDALLVALYYSLNGSVVMPNNGDISLGDVNADGQVDMADAWAIAAWLNDPSDPTLPSGIGEPVAAAAASLSPDPSTVTFADDGAWHRFTVQAGEAVTVVANPEGTTPRLEITRSSTRSNFCPAEAEDDVSRRDGQAVYLAGCAAGAATVELRRASDGSVLNTYTFEVTGSPADLVVQSVSVSDSTLTPGQSFTLSATVRNQGTGRSAATTLRYYRSADATISTGDAPVGTDAVGALGASRTSAESIRLTAPSSAGTWHYGACVAGVSGESDTGNNCSRGVRVTVEQEPDDGEGTEAEENVPTRLTRNSAHDWFPAWSPGTQIAFQSERDGNWEIYVMAADGSQPTNLTRNSARDWRPAWSPDGTQIAFDSYRDRNWEIYVMAADGSQPTRLTRNSGSDRSPAWSPDGTQIAFMSDRDGNDEIYVMAADGSQPTRLTRRNSGGDWSPAWSPDGTQIAFVSDRDGNWEIYVMAADGSQPTRLTRNDADDISPAWSPDGTQIVFVSDRDGNREIYVMAADGSQPTRLTRNSAGDESPAWSPDGTQIVFVSDRDGNREIYVMAAKPETSGDGGGDGGGSCTVGLELNPGEGCSGFGYTLHNDSGVLVVNGSIGGITMINTGFDSGSVRLNNLHLTRSGNVWTIVSLP